MKVNIGPYPKKDSKKRKVDIRIDRYDHWSADHTIALIAAPLLKQLRDNKNGAPYVQDEDVPKGRGLRRSEAPSVAEFETDDNHFKRWDWVLDEMIWTMEEIANDRETEMSFYDMSACDRSTDINEQFKAMKVDRKGLKAYNKRLQNGCVLFGKYFQNLWD